MRDRRLPRRDPAQRQVLRPGRVGVLAAVVLALAAAPPTSAQRTAADAAMGDTAMGDTAMGDTAMGDTAIGGAADSLRPAPAFRFSREAGLGLRAMWEESVSAKQERVACLSASVRNDTVFVGRILELVPHEADSMSIGSEASIRRCGPPEWAGTVHTHVALYSDDLPSTHFSAQDRGVMSRWYERWHTDGVFCLIYSARDAHCEADGVVGGMRSKPIIVR